ncbi:hypothetical protein K504DRAFT_494443 [Pleomassaria siparia CBS 279.74]|uniref:Uncharacterized protein n=1 Tax=Pleomassaria siparia CBS 279.74 TaxID=1314801 RepID=A0A6G1JY00_9PLEO|nr:hypothetical protein K504DRAFT_494443 [Pleomassaria siparia CBS 279.74]
MRLVDFWPHSSHPVLVLPQLPEKQPQKEATFTGCQQYREHDPQARPETPGSLNSMVVIALNIPKFTTVNQQGCSEHYIAHMKVACSSRAVGWRACGAGPSKAELQQILVPQLSLTCFLDNVDISQELSSIHQNLRMADEARCTTEICDKLPLRHLLDWSPFRIDALGIITMIGAEQVNASIGRLCRSRYVEFLPLLGAYIFASDAFTEAKSGFAVYNLTAAITTTDLAGWFSRWCTAQNFEKSHSMVRWTVDEKMTDKARWWNEPRSRDLMVAISIGVFVNGVLLALTILQGDWWGLANAISMVVSVLVRTYVVNQNRHGLDRAVNSVMEKKKASSIAMMKSGGHIPEEEKILVILANAKMVTMYVPLNIVFSCFIPKPEIEKEISYYTIRMIGWIGFTLQVISLGMSGLATQLITVVVMLVSTVLTHFRVGCDDNIIGQRLRADRCDFEHTKTRRQDVYVELELESHEEDSLLQWNLMPHRTSPGAKNWWIEYAEKKDKFKKDREDKYLGRGKKVAVQESYSRAETV